ncbi:ABC transporter ATP-binding protein [Amedibacillus sp. YH-ame10]
MQLLLENVGYSYNGVDVVLQDVNFSFEEGKIYAIVGKSGAGKTTLLSLLSQLTKPTTGKIIYNEKDIKEVDQYEYRSKYVGVVFQNFNLLPNLSAVENVMLSMDIAGIKRADRKEYAMELLRKVGLEDDEANRRILKLSGGQQQRVAIARALSYEPEIILADEPTGNLDEDTQNEIMNIFKQLAYEEQKCIILVTHSPLIANSADQVYELYAQKSVKKKPVQFHKKA